MNWTGVRPALVYGADIGTEEGTGKEIKLEVTEMLTLRWMCVRSYKGQQDKK